MNENKGKLYKALIGTNKVTPKEIGNEKQFTDYLGTRDNAVKLYGELKNNNLFTDNEIGNEKQFLTYLGFGEDTQAKAESYMKEVSGEMPEPKIALADVEAFNKDVDELTKVTIGKVELPKDYEAKADSLNTQIKAIEEDVFSRYSTEAKKLAQTPMTEAEYELSSKELLSKYNQEYKDKTEGARNQFEDLSVAVKNYNEAVKEYNFGIENIKKKYKSGFEAEKKAPVEVTDEERKWVEEIKNNPRKLNVGNAKEVSRYKDIIGRIEAQGKVEQISLEEAKYNIGEAKRYTAGVRKVNQTDSEDAYMTTAERVVASTEGALREIEEAKDNGVFSNMAKGIGGGVKDYFKDYTNLIETMSNNAAIKKVADKAERIDKGSGEKLTDGETALLNAYVVADNTMRAVQDEIPEAYGIGKAVGYSFPYMLEFVVSGGAAKTPMAIAKMKILSTAAKLGVGSKLAKAGVGATVALAKAGIQTAAMPTLYKETAKKVSEGQSFPSAFANAFYEVGAETLSERAFMGKMPKGAETKNFISDILARTGNAVVGSKSALQLLKGIGEEYLEEKISESLTSAKDILQNKQSFEQAWSTFWNYKNNLRTAATVGIVSGIIHGAYKAGQAFTGARIKANVDARGKILPAEVRAVIDEVMGNRELTFEQQRQIIGGVVSNVEGDKVKLIGDAASYIMAKFEQEAFKEGQSVDEGVKNSLFPQGDTEVPSEVESGEITTPEEQETPVVDDIEAEKADIERRRQEELKNRVVYDRFPTVEDGEFKIIGDPNNKIYRINKNTGRPQELDESNGLWSNTAMSPTLFNESTKRSGFEKSKNKINAKYDAELAALNGKEVSPESAAERVAGEPKSVEEVKPLKTEQDAIQEQATDEGVLRPEEPEVELPEMGRGNAEHKEVTEKGEEVEAGQEKEASLKEETIEAEDIERTAKAIEKLPEEQGYELEGMANSYIRSIASKKLSNIIEETGFPDNIKSVIRKRFSLNSKGEYTSSLPFDKIVKSGNIELTKKFIKDVGAVILRDRHGESSTRYSSELEKYNSYVDDYIQTLLDAEVNEGTVDINPEIAKVAGILIDIQEKFIEADKNTPKSTAEAYHKAKAEGENHQFVQAVEKLIGGEAVSKQRQKWINEEVVEVESEGVIAQPTEAVAEKAVGEIPQAEEKKIIAATKDVKSTTKALEAIEDESDIADAVTNRETGENAIDVKFKKYKKGDRIGGYIVVEDYGNEVKVNNTESRAAAYINKIDFTETYLSNKPLRQLVAEAYHDAKKNGNNADLVAAVKKLLSESDVLDEQEKEVKHNKPDKKHESELTVDVLNEVELDEIAKKQSIKPKNLRDVYKAGREVFGLNRVQALAQAIVVDKMVARMAKNKGVSKGKVYEAMTFKKSTIGELSGGAQRLYQSVWHGSPHSFEKFMLDKIGTGEGAQAYGWGIYFTDKESIARAYANMGSQSVMLGDRRLFDVDELEDMLADDEEFAYYTSKKRVIEHAKEVAKTSEEAVKNAESSIDNIKENVRKELERNEREISTLEGELAEARSILDHIIEHKTALGEGASRVISAQEMRAENLKMQIDAKKKITEEKIRNVLMDRYLHELYYQNGILKSANYLLDNIDNLKEISNRNLYKVKLHGDRSIDEFNYLRWDKYVDLETGKNIKEAWLKEGNINTFIVAERYYNSDTGKYKEQYPTGAAIYQYISKQLGSDKEASLFLLRAGIDGIKYPTESTYKGSHEDSFNYVIFDENVAEIEEHIKFQRGQGAQAAVSFLSDGSAIVHALTNPNVSSPLHEVAHIYERYMTANEKATVLRWTGDKSWTTETSEKFARGFERYLADGVAPTEALRRIFERFKEWMTEIYNGITGSEIDIELNDDMRALYGQMLGGKGVRPSMPKAAKTEAELLKEADDLFNQVLFQAPRSPIGFYSTVENALDAIKQAKGTPEQFKAMLLKNGAKQAEMDWMGWDSQFANSKSITKADIQQWIDQNRIEVEEVKKSDFIRNRDDVSQELFGQYYDDLSDSEQEDVRIEINSKIDGATKYSQYQLPGGENYKEVLLTMPSVKRSISFPEYLKSYRERFPKSDSTDEEVRTYYNRGVNVPEIGKLTTTSEGFMSSHFDEPNILAHIRFNERTDSEGNRVLFIEEFQSDWAQKGKKEGFVDNSEYEAIPDGENKWDVGGINVLYFERGKDGKNYRTVNKSNEQVWFATLQEATKEASNTAKDRFRDREIGKVPDMPFKQTPQWVNLALRRMIRYAAENGFDRIAWTTGEQQAERYDLSKQVDSIETKKERNGLYTVLGNKNGKDVFTQSDIPENQLEGIIGKDLAKKIIDYHNEKSSDWHSFSGIDLQVGGEGMKAFYNSIVPNAAKELGKKFGAKVETVEMETGAQQSLPITESMRQSAMEGMPLFQAPTDALTKALNRLIDAAEKAVGKNSAKVTEYVNKYITEKNLPIDKSIVDDILSQRGYTPKPRKARSAEAIEKSIWGLRVEELEPDEKLRAKLIEDKFSSYVPEKWETVQRISDAMYQEMGDTAEDRVENVLSKIKDINVARDYKMTIIANAFNEVNGLIENSTDPEAWRDVKEALYEMMLAHSISMGRSFNYMKNLNRMVFGENFFERMANKKHANRVEKFVEKHKERVGKKFKAESAKLYDEAARENIQSEEVQKAIKKVAEKNGYRSATKEKLAEIRKKKEDLIARHKAAIAQRRGQLSASVLPMGITPEDVEFIGEYVSLLLQEGVYKTKALTDRIRWYVKDAMGVDITEEEARDLLPEDVDGVNFDEWQEGKKKEASAEVLAGRIVGMVKEKKADNDPVKMMIDILTAKARERIPATKRAKMTPLEVLVQAIRNRKEYQKTWEDAKAVVEKRIAAMKVSDEAKADMMSKIDEAYKTATELPFSDAVVTKAVRQTLEELEYVLNKIVLSTATEKAVVKDELKKRIVEQTGLEDEDAEVLAKAIEQAFNAALDSKAQRTVENMIYRLDRQKDVSATKIVEYLNNKGSKMGKDNPYSFLINNLREQAIAKLREIDAENKKTKGVEKYGEAMLKGMSTGRALSLAFIDDIELKEAIVKAQQAVMDKVNDGTYLKGLNEEMRNVIIADLSHFDSRAQTAILKTEEAIIRSRAANELIQFVRIGAFDNGDFAKAYAMAKGMTPPTKAQIDHIKSMYNRMAKEQSEMIKKELEAELLAYMANMGGVDLADILTATLAFSMLGNVAVQIKNTGLAAGAMMIDFLREASWRAITMDKRGLDELVKAYTRNRGLNMAINTFKTGVSHLPQKFDIPDVLYRAKRDVKDSRGDKLIKRALAVYSFTMNWMNASDSFFVFTNAEARIALMTLDKGREELRRNIGVNQKAFLDQFISENLYSVEMREQAEAQVAEDEAELVKQGIDPYTARQRKLAVYDKIDQLRDPELRGEAFDLATRLFGNTDFYGVLGMMMDGFVHYIRTIPVIGNTPLLAPLVFFTRIATNIATYSLNMTPVGWVRLYTGKYGATLNGKNQRYVREISASERKAIMQYQVMGLIIGTAAVSIFLGGDDDDPWFAVCGTGINAAVNGFPYGYKGEKWKKNTIKLGDTYLSYDGTVMQPMFALIGEAMDGYRFNRDKDGKREKDLNKFFMDLAVYFAVSPVSIVNSNYLSLIESVGTTLYGAAEKVINREETIASISGALAMDIPLNNYLNMMYLGDVYEVVKMAMEIPDNDGDKLFDTMAKRTYLEMILNDDRMYRTDVFGDAVIKNPTYFTRGIAEYKGMSEWAEYNAKYYKAIPEARVSDPEFFIEKKGVTEKRSLNAYDKNEAYAFWRYQNIRGRYIKERIMMLKADNVTGDAYREEIKKAIAQAGAFARSEIQAFINEGGLYLK